MSEPDAVPLPREGEVFFDVRGEARCMRLSWYADSAVAVFSIWQGNRCTGTFRLPFGELDRMVQTLQTGPYRHGSYRHLPGPADRQRYGERSYQLPDYDPPNYTNAPAYDPPSYDPPNYDNASHYGSQAGYGNAYDQPDYAHPPRYDPPDYGGAPQHAPAAASRPDLADDTAPEAPFGRVPVPPDRGASTYHSRG